MNGRKARERRRQEAGRRLVEAAQVPAEATSPVSAHPLGSWAGATMEWRRRKEAAMRLILEEERKALDRCTGEPDCPSLIHYKHCWVGR